MYRRMVLLGALAFPFSAGCTAILDLDRNQCAVDADCTDLFGPTAPYSCVEKVCERPACTTDQSCKERGGVFATSICSDSELLCAPAQCTDNAQCGVGQTCNLTNNRCVKRECDTTEECLQRAASPTVQCIQGFCVDATWGCIGQPDERTRTAGETGTLNVPLLGSDDKPIAGANWQIKVCNPPQFDKDCASPVVGPTSTYDATTGIATISGLSYEMPVRLQFDEPTLEDGVTKYIPMDFYTQRPVVGVTTTPPLSVVLRKTLNALVASFNNVPTPDGGKAVDDTLGNVYGRLFDCENKPAGNVQLTYANALGMPLTKEPIVLFFDEQNVPSLVRQWSFPTGVFSSLNISLENINVATTLIVDPNSMPIKTRSIRSEYALRLASQRMTTVHFYPRSYSK